MDANVKPYDSFLLARQGWSTLHLGYADHPSSRG